MGNIANTRPAVGRRGEDSACEFLMGLGHTVLHRNWRTGHLEIDVVTSAPDGIHFVEVKSRVAPAAAAPEDNAGRRKLGRIAEAAGRYLRKYPQRAEEEIWFDVVTVVFDGGKTEVEYYPGAYIPVF